MGDGAAIDFLKVTAHGERALRAIARLQLSAESPERTIVLLATVAEEHVATILRALVAMDSDKRTRLYQHLLDDVDDSMYRSWDSMYKWFKAGFELSMAGAKEAQEFDALVDLRNAIVHGNGRLTRFQTQKFAQSIGIRQSLSRLLDVSFSGNDVVLGVRTVSLACSTARRFVAYFDAKVLSTYPAMLSV